MKLDLQLSATAECKDILIEVYLDSTLLLKTTATQTPQSVTCEIDETPGDHDVTLVMTGKNHSHTVVSDAGEIIDDIHFKIDKLEFEELDMTEVFCLGKSCYTHSFNSAQPAFLDEFYGIIGCNGTVKIEFSTPIHLWLLEYI
jgi:hypothetical protein